MSFTQILREIPVLPPANIPDPAYPAALVETLAEVRRLLELPAWSAPVMWHDLDEPGHAHWNLHLHSPLRLLMLSCSVDSPTRVTICVPLNQDGAEPVPDIHYHPLQQPWTFLRAVANRLLVAKQDDFIREWNTPPEAPRPEWTYSHFRAALYHKDKVFALVTPDGKAALDEAAAQQLLAALNRPPVP